MPSPGHDPQLGLGPRDVDRSKVTPFKLAISRFAEAPIHFCSPPISHEHGRPATFLKGRQFPACTTVSHLGIKISLAKRRDCAGSHWAHISSVSEPLVILRQGSAVYLAILTESLKLKLDCTLWKIRGTESFIGRTEVYENPSLDKSSDEKVSHFSSLKPFWQTQGTWEYLVSSDFCLFYRQFNS